MRMRNNASPVIRVRSINPGAAMRVACFRSYEKRATLASVRLTLLDHCSARRTS